MTKNSSDELPRNCGTCGFRVKSNDPLEHGIGFNCHVDMSAFRQADEITAVHEARELASELEALVYKAGVAGYNLERSFTDNCKEISGKGLNAEEARRKWGINK